MTVPITAVNANPVAEAPTQSAPGVGGVVTGAVTVTDGDGDTGTPVREHPHAAEVEKYADDYAARLPKLLAAANSKRNSPSTLMLHRPTSSKFPPATNAPPWPPFHPHPTAAAARGEKK